MATTRVLSGSILWEPKFRLAFGGDFGGGQETPTLRHLENWSHDGGAAPTLSGWLYGTLAVSVGTLLLAHATDPFAGMGDAQYSEGLAVAGKRLKLLYLRADPANAASVTIERASSNGLEIFTAAGSGIILAPGGRLIWEDPLGIGPLSTGTNDALTLTPDSGTPAVTLLAVYGT
jgi:hypothetical protein